MLQKLVVKNYAIIDRIEVDFSSQLNIITGETGAGKSILLGALSLILGQRADTKVLYNKTEKCISEATFNISSRALQGFFEEHDLDYEDTTIIRREIAGSGKSRAFINDTPVTLDVLKELGSQLINLHSQHETLALNNADFQLQLVDAVADHEEAIQVFSTNFQQYRSIKNELEGILAEYQDTHGDVDYLQYQLNELYEAQLEEGEQEQIEEELKVLENAEVIKRNLSQASLALSEDEQSIQNQMGEVAGLLRSIENYHSSLSQLNERLESCIIELQDIAGEIEDIANRTDLDPEKMEELNDRLDLIFKLQTKHKLSNTAELLGLQTDLQDKLDAFDAIKEKIKSLEAQLEDLEEKLTQQANILQAGRKKAAPKIEQEVTHMLATLGMPDAQFKVEITPLPFTKVNAHGLDKIRFLFTANKGMQPEELKKVASGGELSRLMLVLKSLIASNTSLPTLIFDEIDSGISGEVSMKVGQLLEQLGKDHQLISITHLPQIASKGQAHFFVYKETLEERTVTRIRTLDADERITEIAKMLAGDAITDAAYANAKELLLN